MRSRDRRLLSQVRHKMVFKYASQLVIHQRIDTRERLYACEWQGCDQKFSRKCSLYSHIERIHEKMLKSQDPFSGKIFLILIALLTICGKELNISCIFFILHICLLNKIFQLFLLALSIYMKFKCAMARKY